MAQNNDDDEESGGAKKPVANKSEKKGFDEQGRLSLRIDAQEATRYQANKDKGDLNNQINQLQNVIDNIVSNQQTLDKTINIIKNKSYSKESDIL